MSVQQSYALLIGVDDYSAYDASTGKRRGTSDLPGSRDDVVAFFRTCLAVGLPAGNIRVLASPRLDPALLPGIAPENVGEATEHAVAKGAAWLADAASAAGGAALLTFSGHGAQIDGGRLVVCPSDTAGPTLERAVAFEALCGIFDGRGALPRLTLILDACFASAGKPLDPSLPRERRTIALGARDMLPGLTREVHAAGPIGAHHARAAAPVVTLPPDAAVSSPRPAARSLP